MNKIITTSLLPSLAAAIIITMLSQLLLPLTPTYGQVNSTQSESEAERLHQQRLQQLLQEKGMQDQRQGQQQQPPTGTTTTTSPPTPSTTTTTTTVPTSARTQEIIDRIQNRCSLVTPPILTFLCVSVVYEGPIKLVLTGDLLIVRDEGGGYANNPYIWMAVEELRTLGYTSDDVLLTGQGTQGNPHSWYIVMSK